MTTSTSSKAIYFACTSSAHGWCGFVHRTSEKAENCCKLSAKVHKEDRSPIGPMTRELIEGMTISPAVKERTDAFRQKTKDRVNKSRGAAAPAPAPAPEPSAPAPSLDVLAKALGDVERIRKGIFEEMFAAGKAPALSPDDVEPIVEKVLASRGIVGGRDIEISVNGVKREVEGTPHAKFADVLELAEARQDILLVGPTGSGKTFLAKQVSEAMELSFGSISLSPGVSEGQLLGRLLPTGKGGAMEYHSSAFVKAYEEGGVFLIDEMDAGDPSLLLILNQGISNGYLPVPNRVESPVALRHKDFILVASANTVGMGANRIYVGRNQLDGSTLDRFIIGSVTMDYDRDLEKRLVNSTELLERAHKVRDKIDNLNKGGRCVIRRAVSTRFLIQADDMIAASPKWNVDRAMEQLVSGWTADEKAKVGL